MKILIVSFTCMILTICGQAQYYYKDIIVTAQTTGQNKLYRSNKVGSVKLSSFEGNGQPSEGFSGDQTVDNNGSRVITHTRAVGNPETWIIATYGSSGHPTKIVDTSDTYRSTSDYTYDARGQLLTISNNALETDNHVRETEVHQWTYDTTTGKPVGMLKIRNSRDTTTVKFTLDPQGSISEEHPSRNGSALPTVYYYYDEKGRLTDIVRYNARAKRMLPDYIFEYDESDRLTSMLVVPEGSNDYQKWLYSYSDKGLKTKEACYNKQKQLLGRIEYQYNFKQ